MTILSLIVLCIVLYIAIRKSDQEQKKMHENMQKRVDEIDNLNKQMKKLIQKIQQGYK